MGIMKKLKKFVAQEPVVAASCLVTGAGLFVPAVVRPILDPKQFPQPALGHVGGGMPGKKKQE